jgi:ATP-dependent helicase HrpA
MAAEQVETSKVYARTVAKIEPEWIEQAAPHLVKHNYYDPHWEKKAARCAVHERTLLYGLTLQAGRKIPYEHVDAKAARQIFIQSALVDHDYHSNAPFYAANQKLLITSCLLKLLTASRWINGVKQPKKPILRSCS